MTFGIFNWTPQNKLKILDCPHPCIYYVTRFPDPFYVTGILETPALECIAKPSINYYKNFTDHKVWLMATSKSCTINIGNI